MLTRADSYETLVERFRWQVPARFNIARAVCHRWADVEPHRLALVHVLGDGGIEEWAFDDIRRRANRLANALRGLGVGPGDRVAILLGQHPDTAVAHVAAYAIGAIAVPLFALFGPDALEFRLADSEARLIITDGPGAAKVESIRHLLPALRTVVTIDGVGDASVGLDDLLVNASADFEPLDTAADDPALIIYTSGTTGPPKGALHAHRVLLGHLPGVEYPHEFFPHPDDRFWTPADWAWIGGLLDVLFPSWFHGVAVVAHRPPKFDPEQAFALMAQHRIRNVFLPPTALKLMRQAPRRAGRRRLLELRTVGSGGEPLGMELLDWGRETLGVTINEFYGQTEANLVIANCHPLVPVRAGSMGRAVPGHRVGIVDDAGTELPDGETGSIAVGSPDPVMTLGYWRNPAATAEKFAGEWWLTGDLARREPDGSFWFSGRADDVITSAGYRIGPAEIEDCLLRHPAVEMAAVIGVPDPMRTERIKAFIVPAPGFVGDERLSAEIQAFVRERLAAHEYPREVEFVDSLPLTTTGKIMRRTLREREVARIAREAAGDDPISASP